MPHLWQLVNDPNSCIEACLWLLWCKQSVEENCLKKKKNYLSQILWRGCSDYPTCLRANVGDVKLFDGVWGDSFLVPENFTAHWVSKIQNSRGVRVGAWSPKCVALDGQMKTWKLQSSSLIMNLLFFWGVGWGGGGLTVGVLLCV